MINAAKLDAFRKLTLKDSYQDVVLIVSGGVRREYAPYFEFLKKKVETYGLTGKVIFTGYVPKKEIPHLYQRADVVVLPYTFPVGNSSPAMYAIQMSKPLIATCIFPFSDEFLDGVNALLVPPGNVNRLAKALKDVLSNHNFRNYLSENIKQKGEGRGWVDVAKIIFEGVYLECLAKK